MVKVRITSKGIIEEPGSGLVYEGTAGKVQSNTLTANTTLADLNAGSMTLSASQGVLTITLPAVASCPGSHFYFNTSSPSAHVITSSQDAGNLIFNATSNGSSLAFPAVANASCVIASTGTGWAVIATSGSFSLTKGAP